ncbi:hypothetical protein RWE15_06340 [Virgibacillus halophilus]|uniref:Fur-regulated basic protein B n=1 Tax=Tigheibacillus halophilus TaxID=361280 RepID=A0ABU5C4D0_9BACI|nr:hypothetical protein [Virgibacillus halophilus]
MWKSACWTVTRKSCELTSKEVELTSKLSDLTRERREKKRIPAGDK